ncbi:hypothetical protein HDU76_006981 [Blyttiomyces sp. JEL0837]|nr:hypothetical protein HDU76_006981 [Blyttiomyces sp. JEL0837]
MSLTSTIVTPVFDLGFTVSYIVAIFAVPVLFYDHLEPDYYLYIISVAIIYIASGFVAVYFFSKQLKGWELWKLLMVTMVAQISLEWASWLLVVSAYSIGISANTYFSSEWRINDGCLNEEHKDRSSNLPAWKDAKVHPNNQDTQSPGLSCESFVVLGLSGIDIHDLDDNENENGKAVSHLPTKVDLTKFPRIQRFVSYLSQVPSNGPTAYFWAFVEIAVSVFGERCTNVNMLGLESVSYILSDTLSRGSAVAIVLIMLGFSAEWSRCFGSINLQAFAWEVALSFLISFASEVLMTMWERLYMQYDLLLVVEMMKEAKFDWRFYCALVCMAGTSLSNFMLAESGSAKTVYFQWKILTTWQAWQNVAFINIAQICLEAVSLLLVLSAFTIGVSANTYFHPDWVDSVMTVLYLGFAFPLAKTVVLAFIRKSPFWTSTRKRLQQAGVDEKILLQSEVRFFILYDILFGVAGRVLVYRTRNLTTYVLSVLGASAFRFLCRFINSAFWLKNMTAWESKLTVISSKVQAKTGGEDIITRNGKVHPEPSSLPVYGSNIKPIDIDMTNIKFNKEEQVASSNTHDIEIFDTVEGGKYYNSMSCISEMADLSQFPRIQSFVRYLCSIPDTGFLGTAWSLVEAAASVLGEKYVNANVVGVESVISFLTDTISRATAGVIVLIMLGYDAPWSTCFGTIEPEVAAWEILASIGFGLLVETVTTMWEISYTNYDLRVVVEMVEDTKLDWRYHLVLAGVTGTSLAIFMLAETGVLKYNPCFS